MKFRHIYIILTVTFLLSACSWIQGLVTTNIDTNDLGELFRYREIAIDQGKLLKSMIGPTIPMSEVRRKYTNVATNFNSTLSVLQTSIIAGNDPKNYQASLRKNLDDIKGYVNDLEKYTQEKSGASTESRMVVSEVVVAAINGIAEIWKNYQESLKKSRSDVNAQLETQRMPSFEKL